MKIALVTYALEIGGVESMLHLLSGYFRAKHHEVVLVETSTKGVWSEYLTREGESVVSILISPWESRLHHVKRIAHHLQSYDVILLNDAPFAQSIVGLLPPRSVVMAIVHNALPSMVRNAIANLEALHQIVAVSPALQEEIERSIGEASLGVTTIANGVVTPQNYSRANRVYQVGEELKLLYVGRVEHHQKGVEYLPTIIEQVLAQGGEAIHLSVIGDGESMESLREEIQRLQLTAHISLLGSREHSEVIAMMEHHHIVLMPSHYEGHPIVLMEAMAQGMVPLVTRLTGHTDHVVEEGESGYLFPLERLPDGFADRIIALQGNPLLLQHNAYQAWKQIATHFSADEMGRAYLELIEGVGSSPRPRSGEVVLSLLGDLPWLWHLLVRPVRKIARWLGVWEHLVRL